MRTALAPLAFALCACGAAILGERVAPCESCEVDAGPDAAQCPSLEVPTCDAGSAEPVREGDCVVAYRCVEACETTCTTLEACGSGRWSSQGVACAEGQGCCRLCPPISAPPASFCDGGPIGTVYEGTCAVGFECL